MAIRKSLKRFVKVVEHQREPNLDEIRFLLVYVPEEELSWEEMETLAIERCDAEADEFGETVRAFFLSFADLLPLLV